MKLHLNIKLNVISSLIMKKSFTQIDIIIKIIIVIIRVYKIYINYTKNIYVINFTYLYI